MRRLKTIIDEPFNDEPILKSNKEFKNKIDSARKSLAS